MKSLNHIFNTNGHKESIDSLLKGSQSKTCSASLSNELGRLAQGINNVRGNDVVDFIHKSDVSTSRVVTYTNMICDYRPHKNGTLCQTYSWRWYAILCRWCRLSCSITVRDKIVNEQHHLRCLKRGTVYDTWYQGFTPSNNTEISLIYANTFQILFPRHVR